MCVEQWALAASSCFSFSLSGDLRYWGISHQWKRRPSRPLQSRRLVLIIIRPSICRKTDVPLDVVESPGVPPSRPAASEGLSLLGWHRILFTPGQTWFDQREALVIDDSTVDLQPRQSGLTRLLCERVWIWMFVRLASLWQQQKRKRIRVRVWSVQMCTWNHPLSSSSAAGGVVVVCGARVHTIPALLEKAPNANRFPPSHPQVSSAVAVIKPWEVASMAQWPGQKVFHTASSSAALPKKSRVHLPSSVTLSFCSISLKLDILCGHNDVNASWEINIDVNKLILDSTIGKVQSCEDEC